MTAPPRVVTLIPGDGIGPEVTAAVTPILEASGRVSPGSATRPGDDHQTLRHVAP